MARSKNRQFKRTGVRTPTGPPLKLNPQWGSRRMAQLDGRQVKCCTYDRGERWISALDNLPLLVRRRLADARYNICPTCMSIDTRNNGAPTLKLYFAVIEAIERVLEQAERRPCGWPATAASHRTCSEC